MIITNPSTIDFTKYNRFFVFGCSFTFYRYPTWANIIRQMMPDIEFYNFAASGAGNMFISNRITEINNKYKFNDSDLIMIMWSTHCREDRFINKSWHIPGNIFSQQDYDEKFVRTKCDPLGYLIKDLSLIELTTGYLKTLSCDSYQMMSVPITSQHENDPRDLVDSVLETYKDLLDMFGLTLQESLINNKWPVGVSYINGHGVTEYEYHPDTVQYGEFLVKHGFILSETAKQYIIDSSIKAKESKSHEDLRKNFGKEFYFTINGVDASESDGFRNWI